MGIRVALHHKTSYRYERPVRLGAQVVRLRPAPHSRTPVLSYSLKIEPEDHFINWQQDPQGNYLARLLFNSPTRVLEIEVDLVADLSIINPFDFFIESGCEDYPFEYAPALARQLRPYLELAPQGKLFERLLGSVERTKRTVNDFLVELNQKIHEHLQYVLRYEQGLQTPEETLKLGRGACRDFAWLEVQLLRHLGLAARFVSGYSIQLTPDVKPLEGPSGVASDVVDLHAWAEVYIPGAGWIGMDATSGLLAAEGHIPLACAADPEQAAPLSGTVEKAECEMAYSMSVTRLREDPRTTKPYAEEQWEAVLAAGEAVDLRLAAGDVRLTQGGEPTFVSVDDYVGEEWNTTAMGPNKRRLSEQLVQRLRERFAPGAMLHFGQGKWYPSESLPRWALGCYWRPDGEPIWADERWLAGPSTPTSYDRTDAERFVRTLAKTLAVDPSFAIPAYEDIAYYLWREQRLPINVDPSDSRLEDAEERTRLAQVFDRGLGNPVGYVLPLERRLANNEWVWQSGLWMLRTKHLTLVQGDSPIGLRLPRNSLAWVAAVDYPYIFHPDPMEPRPPLPPRAELRQVAIPAERALLSMQRQRRREVGRQERPDAAAAGERVPASFESASWVVRTALCVEARGGRVHVFMPPQRRLEDYLALVTAIEEAAAANETPVVLEGYLPPEDPRIANFKVTPDPGVIEVNVQPAASWRECVELTTELYEIARQTRLGPEKFLLDGRQVGTGGGNHVVLGGRTPADSPFLRRPDVLRSLIAYWVNHPSLSYLFSSLFIGPTSQAPRVDEARHDSLYELEIAFEQVPDFAQVAAWHVDRVFRHLLVDVSGNTHRAELCIDKLYSPDSSSGRLGLVEFRSFEMPPNARMSVVQQLLLRALVARFWEQPYHAKLVRWGNQLRDRFMLPHFVRTDLEDVIEDLRDHGFGLDPEWFAPHYEFRFPRIGTVQHRGIEIELRCALEPWHVLGEEPGGGGAVRYVDSSLERLQVKVSGMTAGRHVIACNGIEVPLFATGTSGVEIGGVRFRAWWPARCLHPTIGIHSPLIFDVVDTWSGRSIGGCTYYVSHPGGRGHEVPPVNAYEAEGRRLARFVAFGHTPGPFTLRRAVISPEQPITLDLRRYG